MPGRAEPIGHTPAAAADRLAECHRLLTTLTTNQLTACVPRGCDSKVSLDQESAGPRIQLTLSETEDGVDICQLQGLTRVPGGTIARLELFEVPYEIASPRHDISLRSSISLLVF